MTIVSSSACLKPRHSSGSDSFFSRALAAEQEPAEVSVYTVLEQAARQIANADTDQPRALGEIRKLVRVETHPDIGLRLAQAVVGVARVIEQQQVATRTEKRGERFERFSR